jgi:hypothetical protein
MGAVLGLRLKGLVDQRCNLLILKAAWSTGAQFIMQTFQAFLKKAFPLHSQGEGRDTQARGDVSIGHPVCGQQHNPGTAYQTGRKTARSEHTLQLLLFLGAQGQWCSWTSSFHLGSLVSYMIGYPKQVQLLC